MIVQSRFIPSPPTEVGLYALTDYAPASDSWARSAEIDNARWVPQSKHQIGICDSSFNQVGTLQANSPCRFVLPLSDVLIALGFEDEWCVVDRRSVPTTTISFLDDVVDRRYPLPDPVVWMGVFSSTELIVVTSQGVYVYGLCPTTQRPLYRSAMYRSSTLTVRNKLRTEYRSSDRWHLLFNAGRNHHTIHLNRSSEGIHFWEEFSPGVVGFDEQGKSFTFKISLEFFGQRVSWGEQHHQSLPRGRLRWFPAEIHLWLMVEQEIYFFHQGRFSLWRTHPLDVEDIREVVPGLVHVFTKVQMYVYTL